MTNAPIYQSQVGNRQVNQTMVRNADTAASFGSEVGAALMGVKPAADNWIDALQMRDKLEGETRVRERTEVYRARTRDTVAGYSQASGMDAVAQREDVTQRLERVRQEEAAKITNPREREAFLAGTSGIAMSRADDVANKASAESKQANVDSLKATTSGYQEDALDHFTDDAKFEDNLAAAAAAQRQLGGLMGTPPEVLDRAEEELVMDTLTQRAVLIADKNPEQAMQYIDGEERLSATQRAKIKEALEPMVREYRVNKAMSQFIVTGSGGSSFMDSTRARESGGDPNAQNANSSAGGLYQYVDETWDQSVMLAKGAGALPPEYADMSVADLRAAKMDPVLQTAVMAYDEGRYEAVLTANGVPVNNMTKYMVHHFGLGAGPAILATAQQDPSASAASVYAAHGWDWDGVVKANPGLSANMTVGELRAYGGSHIGQGGGIGGAVVQFDFAKAYAYAQTIEDPAERAAFLSTVEAREATETARQRAARGQVIDGASTRYFETGESSLSMAEQMTLGIDGTTAFRDMVNRNESGKLTTDVSVWGMLSELTASTDPNVRKMIAADGSIEMYVNKLSKEDYRAMVERRSMIRAEIAGTAFTDAQKLANPALAVPVKADQRAAIGRHLDRVGIAGGAKNAEQRAQAEYDMTTRLQQQMIDFYKAERREPTETEVDDMIFAQTLQAVPEGNFGTPAKMMFQTGDLPDGAVIDPDIEYAKIPAPAREEMTVRLAAILGRTPTPEEVSAAYVNSVLVKGRMAPEPLDILEVPMDVFSHGALMGMSEDEIRAQWEDYVNKVLAGLIEP